MDNIEKKKYDNKKYYQNFKEKHKDELKETIKCEICGGSYKYFNKPIHNKTKKHIEFLNGTRKSKEENEKILKTTFFDLSQDDQMECIKQLCNYLLKKNN